MAMTLERQPKPYEESEDWVFFWSGTDSHGDILEDLVGEFAKFPYAQFESSEDGFQPYSDTQSPRTNLSAVIYIPKFFTDDVDACYLVRSNRMVSQFLKGIWGASPWKGWCFITPIVSTSVDSLFSGNTGDARESVTRSDFRGKRHHYFYESAVEAWKNVEIHLNWIPAPRYGSNEEEAEDGEIIETEGSLNPRLLLQRPVGTRNPVAGELVDPEEVKGATAVDTPHAGGEENEKEDLEDYEMVDEDDDFDVDDTELLQGRW